MNNSPVITVLTPSPTRHEQASAVLVSQWLHVMTEVLQGRRSPSGLGRACSSGVKDVLAQWRDQLDWHQARVGLPRAQTGPDGAVEGWFSVAWGDYRETFVLRFEQRQRRWTCVLVAPVRDFDQMVRRLRRGTACTSSSNRRGRAGFAQSRQTSSPAPRR